MPASKRKYLAELTAEQRAQMDPWADKWIEIGLRTGPADRERLAAARVLPRGHSVAWWQRCPALIIAVAAPAALAIELIGDSEARRSRAVPFAMPLALPAAVRYHRCHSRAVR